MYEWLGRNIKYPAIARENGIEGKAIVQFVVEPDGRISQVNCVRGPEGGCKEEAARVIAMMPKWIPGKQQGRPVRVRYTLPVVFKLE
jgi:protein TonB